MNVYIELRKAALERIKEELKKKWKEILVPSFIASEESGEETVDGVINHFLYVKSLPWRAAKVNNFMSQLDEKAKKNKHYCKPYQENQDMFQVETNLIFHQVSGDLPS